MNENGINPRLTIALAGNPNAGKTTLFNSLTGLNQKVANYPGVTVERKEGAWDLGDRSATLIDLPGLYSLDATSLDEQIARDVITGKIENVPKPDVIVSVVDATNLERNLYLTTQLFEFGVPVVIALTMIDVFEKQKHEIDIIKLSKSLGVPVIAVNAEAEEEKGSWLKACSRLRVQSREYRTPLTAESRTETTPESLRDTTLFPTLF